MSDYITHYWKSFLISFIATFIMVALSHAGLNFPKMNVFTKLINPAPQKVDALDNLKPKLEEKPLNFEIKNKQSLIKTSQAAGEYDLANAYVVVDGDNGEVLAEKNSTTSLPIASLTKIMTAVVALDLASPADTFTVSKKAAQIIPTKIGVVEGQKMTLEELLDAAMLTSANDAVQVIKEGIDQKVGEEVFIRAMNEKAQFLGLKNSHFSNPQGFDNEKHYSSAQDLAILTQYALTNYPLFKEIVKKPYQFLPENNLHKQFDLYNWNGLLGVYPEVLGVKIGNTDEAKYTTVVASQRNGKKLITVLLGAPGVLERDLWASQLLDLGFEKSLGLKPVNVTKEQLKEKYSTWKYWN